MNFLTLTKQAQDFVLRLFIESGDNSTPVSRDYTCARCGTFTRIHQS